MILCTSCIKDFLGKKNKIQIAEDNYVYEGETYGQYLAVSLTEVEEEIQELQEIIDNNQGDGQTEEDLATAQEQQAYLSNEISNLIDVAGIGVVPPRPPCPDADLCFPNGLLYLLTDRQLGDFTFEAFDAQGNSLLTANADGAKSLKGSQGVLNFNELPEVDYVGEITINVIRNDSQGNEVSYGITAFQQ